MIDKHHIHPKFMDNKKGLGKLYDLEHEEHIKLHFIIPSIIWKYVEENKKRQCINEVIRFSENYIKNIDNIKKERLNQKELFEKYNPDEDPLFLENHCLCGAEIDEEDCWCHACGNIIEKNTITEKEEDSI